MVDFDGFRLFEKRDFIPLGVYKGSDLSSVDWAAGKQIVPLFNPREQKWNDHFELEGVRLKPLTAPGRVTIFLLRLNTLERIEERELLISLNTYPCF